MTSVKNITSISGMNIPLLLSTKGYKKKYLQNDIMAGLVVTAIAVPELMGIATMAGVPVQVGLYSAVLAPIVFALFSVSRRLIVGADSATAVLLASGAGALATAGSDYYLQIVFTIGLMSAIMLALISFFKLSFLADLISRPVMIGFLAGVGLQLMITKLPEMIGLHLSGTPVEVLANIPMSLGHLNGMALTIAALVIGSIVIFHGSRIPGALIALLAAGGLVFVFEASTRGVAMVGALPHGFPGFSLPMVPLNVFVSLVPVAFSVAVVILAQSTSVIRSNADEHDEKPNVQQDLIALSFAGIVSSLTHGLAINGSPPRTLAADFAGMRSQVATIIMSLIIALLLLVGGGIFKYLPVAALAAIVFMMGYRLIRFRELRYLAQHHKMEFVIALAACIGVVVFGVFTGIIIAVTASLMERLRREYHPSDGILLKDGKLSEWASDRVVGIKSIPDDVLVFGFDASLFFENSQYFGHRLRQAIRSADKPLRMVVIDTSAMDDIDYTAVEQLKLFYRHLSVDSISLGFSHVSPHLMRQFDDYGVIDLVGEEHIFTTLRSAIEYRPPARDTILDRVKDLKLPEGEYIVVGGAVMEVLNLRESNNIDIVVSNDVYNKFAGKAHWHEYSLSTGKLVLTRDGVNLMRSWLGRTLGMIKKHDTFTRDGVLFMGKKQLVTIKQHLGRRKDQSDIALLKSQQIRDRD